jgi:transposase-like protein
MKKYSDEERAMWLEDWKQSGKSAWAYAKENGINGQTFMNWTKAGNETKQSFVEVPGVSAVVKQTMGIPEIVIEKGDVKIYVPLVINHNQLRAVIEGIGASI